ncbi:uncharacterized protein ACIBXB_012713 isoform 1-T2 [Morphnus guianensis]
MPSSFNTKLDYTRLQRQSKEGTLVPGKKGDFLPFPPMQPVPAMLYICCKRKQTGTLCGLNKAEDLGRQSLKNEDRQVPLSHATSSHMLWVSSFSGSLTVF